MLIYLGVFFADALKSLSSLVLQAHINRLSATIPLAGGLLSLTTLLFVPWAVTFVTAYAVSRLTKTHKRMYAAVVVAMLFGFAVFIKTVVRGVFDVDLVTVTNSTFVVSAFLVFVFSMVSTISLAIWANILIHHNQGTFKSRRMMLLILGALSIFLPIILRILLTLSVLI